MLHFTVDHSLALIEIMKLSSIVILAVLFVLSPQGSEAAIRNSDSSLMGRLEEMEQKLESVTAELEQEKARRLSVETDVADIVKNAIDNNNKENTVPDDVINQVFSEAEAAEAEGEGSRRELALAADGDGNHRNLLVSGSWCTMKVLLAGPHWYTVRSLGTTYSNSCFRCPSGYGKYFNDITATKYTEKGNTIITFYERCR